MSMNGREVFIAMRARDARRRGIKKKKSVEGCYNEGGRGPTRSAALPAMLDDDDDDAKNDANDDARARMDEIAALRAIFAEDFDASDASDGASEVVVALKRGSWRLSCALPLDYPSSSPPIASALCLKSRDERAMALERWASEDVKRCWLDAGRACCVFDWLERAREEIERMDDDDVDEEEEEEEIEDDASTVELTVADELEAIARTEERRARTTEARARSVGERDDALVADVRRRLTSHAPVVVQKSVFQAHVCRECATVDDVDAVLSALAESRKFREATHNVLAYRIERGATFAQDYDDDGETAAGARLLRMLQLSDKRNVVVVVSRWYGGTKLGPKRFQIINAAALDAINNKSPLAER